MRRGAVKPASRVQMEQEDHPPAQPFANAVLASLLRDDSLTVS